MLGGPKWNAKHVGISVAGDIPYMYSKSNNLESGLKYTICMVVKLLVGEEFVHNF